MLISYLYFLYTNLNNTTPKRKPSILERDGGRGDLCLLYVLFFMRMSPKGGFVTL